MHPNHCVIAGEDCISLLHKEHWIFCSASRMCGMQFTSLPSRGSVSSGATFLVSMGEVIVLCHDTSHKRDITALIILPKPYFHGVSCPVLEVPQLSCMSFLPSCPQCWIVLVHLSWKFLLTLFALYINKLLLVIFFVHLILSICLGWPIMYVICEAVTWEKMIKIEISICACWTNFFLGLIPSTMTVWSLWMMSSCQAERLWSVLFVTNLLGPTCSSNLSLNKFSEQEWSLWSVIHPSMLQYYHF